MIKIGTVVEFSGGPYLIVIAQDTNHWVLANSLLLDYFTILKTDLEKIYNDSNSYRCVFDDAPVYEYGEVQKKFLKFHPEYRS